MIRGVLFDLDGVIVDTAHYHFLAWKHMFEREGGAIEKRTVLLNEGMKSKDLLAVLMRESGVRIPVKRQESFLEDKRNFYREIARIECFPGALETVRALKSRGTKVALVTATARGNMQFALDPELQSAFEVIITGDELEQAKPLPEPYLIAAGRLGLTPAECVAVENAPLGIEAAKAAGIYCIAVATTLEREQLRAADSVLEDIGKLHYHPVFAA